MYLRRVARIRVHEIIYEDLLVSDHTSQALESLEFPARRRTPCPRACLSYFPAQKEGL